MNHRPQVKPGQVWQTNFTWNSQVKAYVLILDEINYQNNCCRILYENGDIGKRPIDGEFFAHFVLVPEV